MSRLRVRMRPDLVIERAAAVDRWVVFDPVALRYFELRDEECAVLRMLDGKIDVAELRARFERIFAPQRLSAPVLESFLHRLHEYGLVLADSPGQGQVWDSRRQAARRRAWWLACANPLAIRLPAIGAADAVARLARAVGWLFTPPVMWMAFVAVSWAAFVAATHSEELASELPRAQAWFAGETSHGPVSNGPVSSGLVSNGPFSHGASPPGIATALAANLWWLATLAVVKCCHELGHALLLAHWGGRVHAVGAMLFVFAPALYCDVSDAWRLPSRWRRVAVGMAGVGAELFLAAVAVAVWRMTEPGLWHALALKTMVVCTIGTLFFNANPLVRGDAYYVLADLAGVPNLATEARRALSRSIRGVLMGHEPDRGEGGGDDGGDHGGVDGVPPAPLDLGCLRLVVRPVCWIFLLDGGGMDGGRAVSAGSIGLVEDLGGRGCGGGGWAAGDVDVSRVATAGAPAPVALAPAFVGRGAIGGGRRACLARTGPPASLGSGGLGIVVRAAGLRDRSRDARLAPFPRQPGRERRSDRAFGERTVGRRTAGARGGTGGSRTASVPATGAVVERREFGAAAACGRGTTAWLERTTPATIG